MTKAEARTFIEKHHLKVPEVPFAHFRLQIGNLEEVLSGYSALGADEAALIEKLRGHLKSLDEKLQSYDAFNDPTALTAQIYQAALAGDAERLQ